MSISERLFEERQRLGLSQTQAGHAAGVSMVSWRNWERYGNGSPNAEALASLYAIGFDVLYIVTGVHNEATLSNEQMQVVALMAAMDERGVAMVLGAAQLMTETNPEKVR